MTGLEILALLTFLFAGWAATCGWYSFLRKGKPLGRSAYTMHLVVGSITLLLSLVLVVQIFLARGG